MNWFSESPTCACIHDVRNAQYAWCNSRLCRIPTRITVFASELFLKIIHLFLLIGSLSAAGSAVAAAHSLLISVDDYEEAKLPGLQGPANDVALIKKVLIERFSIPETNITLISNPTHSTLEKVFSEFATKVNSGDQVYIHYSGHGSWAPVPRSVENDGTENGGQDQTWVVHGSRSSRRSGKDSMDVLDKEIALWLDSLYKLTPDVVFVSDSCHSATVSRDIQLGTRSVDGTQQSHPLRLSIKPVSLPKVGLRIGAARDFESAVEFDPRTDGRCSDKKNCYGVFTWHWARALQSSRPGESWGDVFNRTSAALTAKPSVLQRPQMEGVANRAVFAAKFAPLSALVPVIEVASDGTLLLGAGRLFGLTVGSVFEGVKTNAGATARLQITYVTAATAKAKVLNGKVAPGEVVREVSHEYGNNRIRLFVGEHGVAHKDRQLVQNLRKSIEDARAFTLAGFELVSKRSEADWRLEIVHPDSAELPSKGTPLPADCRSNKCAPRELWVVSPFGQLIDEKMRFSTVKADAEVPRLVANLAAMSSAREVRGLGAQGNDTPLQVQVRVLRPPHGNNSSCLDGAKQGSGWQSSRLIALSDLTSNDVQLNDCLAFTLANKDPTRHWYGYILGVDPKFSVQPVWPRRDAMQDEARVGPNSTFTLTKSLYRLSDVGRETLLFVASEAPAPVAGLIQTGLKAASRRNTSQLKRLLDASALTRGPESEIDAWGAQSLELDLIRTADRHNVKKGGG